MLPLLTLRREFLGVVCGFLELLCGFLELRRSFAARRGYYRFGSLIYTHNTVWFTCFLKKNWYERIDMQKNTLPCENGRV